MALDTPEFVEVPDMCLAVPVCLALLDTPAVFGSTRLLSEWTLPLLSPLLPPESGWKGSSEPGGEPFGDDPLLEWGMDPASLFRLLAPPWLLIRD